MATLAQGIVPVRWVRWSYVGMAMGSIVILLQVRSPWLFAWACTCRSDHVAIFVGGMLEGMFDRRVKARGYNAAQAARFENVGVLWPRDSLRARR